MNESYKELLVKKEQGVGENALRVGCIIPTVILGFLTFVFGNIPLFIIKEFYKLLSSQKCKQKTVRDAIGDLPRLQPSQEIIRLRGKKFSHTPIESINVLNHTPRFHSERDIKVFQLLTKDIEQGYNKYTSITALKDLYTKITGKTSNIHKFYVLRWDEPSNTIPAHLYKDELRTHSHHFL